MCSMGESMNNKVLRLAIPNIISNITVPLLSSVDLMLMGHMDDPAYLGAVAVGGVIFNIIYWSLGFLRMGTTGLTAQAYGKTDKSAMILVLAQALSIALFAAVFLIVFQVPIGQLGFWLMGSSEEGVKVDQLALVYYQYRIWAAPATISLYAFMGWFLGMQNARYPMYVTLLINVVNIGANVYFVRYLGMTVEGVALGTVIAQYLGLFLSLYLFYRYYNDYLQELSWHALRQWDKLKGFLAVNSDIFIRTMCLLFTFSYFTYVSKQVGAEMLSANQILLQYLFLLSYGVDGFAYAAESLVGRYVGAKEEDNLRTSIRLSFVWGLGIAAACSVLYWFADDRLLFLFTENEDVIATAKPYLYWLVLYAPIGAAAFIWDGIYIGATAAKSMRNSMIIATFLCFLPIQYFLTPSLGNHALWLAMILFMLVRAITLSAWAKKAVYGKVTQ